jgi:hypothetical protein
MRFDLLQPPIELLQLTKRPSPSHSNPRPALEVVAVVIPTDGGSARSRHGALRFCFSQSHFVRLGLFYRRMESISVTNSGKSSSPKLFYTSTRKSCYLFTLKAGSKTTAFSACVRLLWSATDHSWYPMIEDRQSRIFSTSPMIVGNPLRNLERVSATAEGIFGIAKAVRETHETILGPLPNDLIRLIYLTSIRDYNNGTYLHPALSRHHTADVADRAFQICHQAVFARLLETPISDYVQQLNEYIQHSRSERALFITTWKSLQAYRSAIPAYASPLSIDLFCLNIRVALTILQLAQRRNE